MLARMHRLAGVIFGSCLILTALAWLCSHVGVAWQHQGQRFETGCQLIDGAIQIRLAPTKMTILGRETYRVMAGGGDWSATSATARLLRPTAEGSFTAVFSKTAAAPAPFVLTVPLLGPSLVLLGAVVFLQGVGMARDRRAIRACRCLACGYQLAPTSTACVECGRTAEQAAAAARARRSLRGTAAVSLACVMLLAGAAWVSSALDARSLRESKARLVDYSWFLDVCGPRLDGRVFYAEALAGANDLSHVIGIAGPKSTVVLLPGTHRLGEYGREATLPPDIWLVGCGAEVTTAHIHLAGGSRVRISNLSIDCQDDEFIDARRGELLLQMDGCRVYGYNSGAGGSNAIFAAGSAMLIEGCTFDGQPGRQAQSTSRGDAFDLRGNDRVYLRRTTFIENQEISRNAGLVLDHCEVRGANPTDISFGSQLPSFNVESSLDVRTWGDQFRTDVAQPIDDVTGLTAFASTGSLRAWSGIPEFLLRDLRLDGRLWRRLLTHPSAEVSALAARQCSVSLAPAESLTLAQAITQLDQSPIPANVAVAILQGPDEAAPALEALTGSPRVQANAAALRALLNSQPSLPELVCAATMRR